MQGRKAKRAAPAERTHPKQRGQKGLQQWEPGLGALHQGGHCLRPQRSEKAAFTPAFLPRGSHCWGYATPDWWKTYSLSFQLGHCGSVLFAQGKVRRVCQILGKLLCRFQRTNRTPGRRASRRGQKCTYLSRFTRLSAWNDQWYWRGSGLQLVICRERTSLVPARMQPNSRLLGWIWRFGKRTSPRRVIRSS